MPTVVTKAYKIPGKVLKKYLNSLLLYIIIFFTACQSTQKISSTTNVNHAPVPLADSLVQKMQQGIDFFASGNNPVQWSVSININDEIKFNAADGTAVRVLAVAPTLKPGTALLSYEVKTNNTTLTVLIYQENCDNNNQQKKVEVINNGKRYSGCGSYLYEPALEGRWVLDKIKNIPQAGKDYPAGLPVLQFTLATKQIRGSDGCNRVSGSMEIMGKLITFSPFVSTRMACSNTIAEKIYSTLLSNNIVTYQVKNNYLILSLADDSLVIFRKE